MSAPDSSPEWYLTSLGAPPEDIVSNWMRGEVGMHPNEKLLRDADDAQIRGDVEAFVDFYADDVIVHIPGKSSFAGVYKGKDQFVELFRRFMERVPGVLVRAARVPGRRRARSHPSAVALQARQ